jgi:hypothetical protein
MVAKHGSLQVTFGSTNRSYILDGMVTAFLKEQVGELRRASAVSTSLDIVDAPLTIPTIQGLGVSRATQFVREANLRAFSEENMMTYFPGIVAMGPNQESQNWIGEVVAVEFNGFEHAAGFFFIFGKGTSTVVTADEACLYWSTPSGWQDTTSKDDMNDGGGGGAATGTHIVSSMAEHKGRAYQALIGTFTTNAASGSAIIKIVRSDVGSATAWTADGLSTAATANGIGTDSPYGIRSAAGLLYTATWNGSGTLTIRESSNDGVAWNAFTANPSILSARAPVVGRAAVIYGDGTTAPVEDYWLGTAEGLWHLDISAEAVELVIPFQNRQSAFTGTIIRVNDGIVYTDGPAMHFFRYENGNPTNPLLFSTDDLPALKRGDITSLDFISSKNWIIFTVGGQDSSHNAGAYIYKLDEGTTHNFYYNATAEKPIFAIGFSTETDGSPDLHGAEDNTTAGDSDGFSFIDFTLNPRTISSFNHAAAGELVLPVNELGPGYLTKAAERVESTGTGYSSNNTVTVYKSADAAPIDTDGSWTQLQDTAGSTDVIDGTTTTVYHPATPNATGESLSRVQYRLAFAGTSNNSAYQENFNVFSRLNIVNKFVYTFILNLQQTHQSSVRRGSTVLADMLTLFASGTYLKCIWPGHKDVILKPYKESTEEALTWSEDGKRWGTVNSTPNPTLARILLVEL